MKYSMQSQMVEMPMLKSDFVGIDEYVSNDSIISTSHA